jgi:hypothetical protein
MAMPCKICKHSDRQAIDAVLLEGWSSLRVIGAQYGVSKDSLLRHYRAHIPDVAGDEGGYWAGEDSPRELLRNADDGQGDEESLAVTEKSEPRQMAEVAEQKKEPEPNESPWAVNPERVRQLIEQIRARMFGDQN